MGNNKVATIVLSILFVICFSLGVVGYMNRGKEVTPTPDTPTPNNPTPSTDLEDVVLYNEEVKNIITLDNVLGTVEFVKANKENSNGYVKATIENGKVVVSVDASAFGTTTTPTEEVTTTETVETTDTNVLTTEPVTQENKTYQIDAVDNIVAVQVMMDSTTKTKVYMLDANNKLYASVFYASPASHTGIDTKEYKVDGIESFVVLNTPLDATTDQVYVIFKTSNNELYTDYDFNKMGTLTLTKLTNEEAPVTVEEVQLTSKKSNIEKVAVSYVQSNNILTEDGSVKVYVYKLVEAGLIETDKGATSEECLKDKHNTSLGCVLDKKENGKSLNSNYVTVTKTGNEYKGTYVNE